VGDTVNAQYYRSVAFVVSQPGATVPDDEVEQAVERPAEAPGGVAMRVTRVSGLAACRTGFFSQAFRSMVTGRAAPLDRAFSR
jgi:hypothetical protein